MAQKVSYQELSELKVAAVHYPWSPFTQEEIVELTKKASKYALVNEGDFLIIYAE